jgi:uncharacterized protein (TIGR01777 family)
LSASCHLVVNLVSFSAFSDANASNLVIKNNMSEPSKVLISGASGLIGSSLIRDFAKRQVPVICLTRKKNPGNPQEVAWDFRSAQPVSDLSQLEGLDVAIHLSGANVSARRWSAAYKREIVESRVQTTRALVKTLGQLKKPPRLFLCASAVGIYGDRGDEILTENSHPGNGFLAKTCQAWEEAAESAEGRGMRAVQLRFGVVLSLEGGALVKMLPLFRRGLGGTLGSGRQWMSWVTLQDLVSAVSHVVRSSDISGPVNVTAPIPVTNAEFTSALASALQRPAIFPAPAFALRLAFGEMANEALLASNRAIPARLAESGFHFQHSHVATALQSLLQNR